MLISIKDFNFGMAIVLDKHTSATLVRRKLKQRASVTLDTDPDIVEFVTQGSYT